MPTRSNRLDNLPPYVFSIIGDRIRKMQAEGIDIIRLDIGNPDMPPPKAVVESLAQSAADPRNHGYAGYRGTTSFREAIATHYQSRFGVALNPDTEVLPLIGSKEGIVNLCLAYLDRGDSALVPDIGYPSYAMGARLAGADVHWLRLTEQNGYQPDFDEIPVEVRQKAKLVWVNYPNNPTGASVDVQFYTQLAEFCTEHNILLVSDNPYMDVTFDGHTACSALQALTDKNNILEFYSFSKSYNMAGWRLGAAVGSAEAIKNLLHVKSNVDSGHFVAVYDAGVTALQTPQSWIDERNLIYQARRDRIMKVLPKIGLSAQPSQGSLYVWAKVKNGNVADYVEQALINAHVSLAPGGAYGPGGEHYIRMSVGTADDRLDQALSNLESWYAKYSHRNSVG